MKNQEVVYFKVLCACEPGVELNANDCVRCNRCHKNFHSKCLPLKRRVSNYYCVSCYEK